MSALWPPGFAIGAAAGGALAGATRDAWPYLLSAVLCLLSVRLLGRGASRPNERIGDAMSEDIRSTGIWEDALEMPEALQTTLDDSEGFADASLARNDPAHCCDRQRRFLLRCPGALARFARGEGCPLEVVAVPGGLLAKAVPLEEGDVLLAISSSGEFRDVIEAIESRLPAPLRGSDRETTSRRSGAAGARAMVKIPRQRL